MSALTSQRPQQGLGTQRAKDPRPAGLRGRAGVRAHLEGNSLARKASRGAVGSWAVRTRGCASFQGVGHSGRDFAVAPRLPEPRAQAS